MTVGKQVLFEGFERARGRFAAAVERGDRRDAYYGIFEALNWAVSLDDLLGKTDLRWKGRHDRDIVTALRFARNRVHHQWADALWTEPLIMLQADTVLHADTLLGTADSWVWRDTSALPAPAEAKHQDPKGEAAYKRLLEGHSLEPTMESLSRVFSIAVERAELDALEAEHEGKR